MESWTTNSEPLLPPAGRLRHRSPAPTHLFLWVLKGDHQHHITSLELQLVRVSGRVIVLSLHLQRSGEHVSHPVVPLQTSTGQRLCTVNPCEVVMQGSEAT